MKTIQEIAQRVIDNRYPKSENEKVSDFEMYHILIEAMNQALCQPLVIGSVCDGCGSKFDAMDIKVGVCYCCQKEIKQTDL